MVAFSANLFGHFLHGHLIQFLKSFILIFVKMEISFYHTFKSKHNLMAIMPYFRLGHEAEQIKVNIFTISVFLLDAAL